jgi:hypothetical protein
MRGEQHLFVVGTGDSGDLQALASAHSCPLRPLERPVELGELVTRETLTALDGVRVDPEREGRVFMPQLPRCVGGVIASG